MNSCVEITVIGSPSMPAKRKSRVGGAREGAGRKPILRDARPLTITLDGPDYEAVARLAEKRGASLGAVVREAVKTYVARRKA